MITVTSAQLNAWLMLLIWPLARILALIGSAPIIGTPQFPLLAKIGLAVLLTLLIAPTLPSPVAADPATAAGLMLLVRETLLGLGMGLAMRVVFSGIGAAGDLIGLQMGLGFAQFYDPQTAAQVPVLSQFLGLLATLAFLSINGHLLLIATLAESFRGVPPDPMHALPGNWLLLAQSGGMVMHAAVLLSLPLIAVLLITNAALAVLTRAAPQLNVFAVGFPITIAVGFIGLLLALPYLVPGFERLFQEGLQMMLRITAAP
jgi:flagellar biosynthetic protein FliR